MRGQSLRFIQFMDSVMKTSMKNGEEIDLIHGTKLSDLDFCMWTTTSFYIQFMGGREKSSGGAIGPGKTL